MHKLFLKSILLFGLILLISSCATAPGTTNAGTPGDPASAPGIYVTTSGNDTNAGTSPASALLTIQYAISKAVAIGLTNVNVAAGVYSNNRGLIATNATDITNCGVWITNSGLMLTGGWDASFTNRSGLSVLDGNTTIEHVLSLGFSPWTVSNVLIDGFVILNGNAIGSFQKGGGICGNGLFQLLITNCVISNCTAGSVGGGISLENLTYSAIFAEIVSNYSGNSAGGLYVNTASRVLLDCRIIGNFASYQGGGAFLNDIQYGTNRGSVISNKSVSGGGGLAIQTCGSCVIITTNLWNSSVSENGGGIRISDSSAQNIIGGLIASNSVDVNAQNGGGIMIYNNNTVVSNAVIQYNNAYSGGGVCISGSSANTRILADILCNFANNYGGGIFSDGPNTVISGLLISNRCPGMGGGVLINSGHNNLLTNLLIRDNYALYGGGVMIYTSYNALIDTRVSNNTAGYYGGGLYFSGAYNTNLADIANNRATNANARGGGIYITAPYCAIFGNITGNTSSVDNGGYGGGISADADFLFINAIVRNNSAQWGGGIDLRSANSTVQGTIVSNYADRGGSGIRLRFSPADSHNTRFLNIILTNNYSGNNWGIMYIEGGSTNLTISNCMFGGTGAAEFGIWESSDTTAHVLANNIFLTNTMGYLYLDWIQGNHDITEINLLNSTNINSTNFTGAAVASGNVATNL